MGVPFPSLGATTSHPAITKPKTANKATNIKPFINIFSSCFLIVFAARMAAPKAQRSHNGLRLRRLPVRHSRIGAAVAIHFFLHSVATDVTKEAVPEGPKKHCD